MGGGGESVKCYKNAQSTQVFEKATDGKSPLWRHFPRISRDVIGNGWSSTSVWRQWCMFSRMADSRTDPDTFQSGRGECVRWARTTTVSLASHYHFHNHYQNYYCANWTKSTSVKNVVVQNEALSWITIKTFGKSDIYYLVLFPSLLSFFNGGKSVGLLVALVVCLSDKWHLIASLHASG